MAAMADMAAELGNGPDSRLFREYADGARKAYSWIYSHRRRFRPRSPARQLLPLALGLLPRETDTAGFRRLIKELQKRSYRACTGAFTTAMLLPELTARGCTEDAYRLLLNEEEPGWLSQIENGAVSLWENWYGRDVRGQHAGSRNRYVFGSVVQWLFQDCAGIRLNGERHFVLEPHPGGGLTFAKASVKSLFGTVSLEWQALYGGWSFEVDLPLGTTAELHLPDGSVQLLDGGHHFFGV